MNEKKEETVIDLFDLFGAFIERIWMVAAFTVIGAIIAFAYTFFFITPMYKSTALMYVKNSDSANANTNYTITTGDLTAAKSLVSTYSVILKSRTVIDEVIEVSGVNRTYEEMRNMVDAKAVDNTEVFSITVTSSDPKEAALLANCYADVLPDKITDIVNVSDVKVVDRAVVATKKSSPSFSKNTAIGALLGFVLASVIIILNYLLDDIIHSEDYLSNTYPTIPLLTVIPELTESKDNGYGYYRAPVRKKPAAPAAPAQTANSLDGILNHKGGDING